jgi:hypothetical protein
MDKTGWLSERVLFGAAILVMYFLLVLVSAILPVIVVETFEGGKVGQQAVTFVTNGVAALRDAMLVLGPVIGLMASSIWKSDRADKQNAEAMNKLADTVSRQATTGAAE